MFEDISRKKITFQSADYKEHTSLSICVGVTQCADVQSRTKGREKGEFTSWDRTPIFSFSWSTLLVLMPSDSGLSTKGPPQLSPLDSEWTIPPVFLGLLVEGRLWDCPAFISKWASSHNKYLYLCRWFWRALAVAVFQTVFLKLCPPNISSLKVLEHTNSSY